MRTTAQVIFAFSATLAFAALSPGQNIRRVYESSFEGTDGGWTATAPGGGMSDFARGIPARMMTGNCDNPLPGITGNGPDGALDGTECWGTRLTECYTNGRTSELRQTFDFTTVTNGTLRWLQFVHMWPGDRLRVTVNGVQEYVKSGSLKDPPEEDTLMMFPAGTRGEPQIGWKEEKIDLSDYDGMASVEIVFQFISDDRGNAPGVYIDDVVITSSVTPEDDDVGFFWYEAPSRNVGDPFTQSGTIVNHSSTMATNVTVQGTLPSNVSFSAADSGPGVTHDGSATGGTWQAVVDSLSPFEAAFIGIGIVPTEVGSLNLSGCASSDFPDPNASNDCDSATVQIGRETDLTTTLYGDAGAVPSGAYNYEVWINNQGPSDSSGVSFTIELPDDVSFVNTSMGSHDGSPSGGVIVGAIPTLASGAMAQVDVQTLVTAEPLSDVLAATASAELTTSTDFDPTPGDNTSTWIVNFKNPNASTEFIAGSGGLEDQVGATVGYVHPPGLTDRRYNSFGRSYASPDQQGFGFRAFLEADTDPANQVIVVQRGVVTQVVKSAPIILAGGAGVILTDINQKLAVGNDNSVVFTGETDTPADVVVHVATDGTTTVVAEQNQPVPGAATTYGFNPSDPGNNDGTVSWFTSTFGPISSSVNEFVFQSNDLGATLTPLLQEGVSTFTDPAFGVTEALDEIDGEFTSGRNGVYYGGVNGSSYLLRGDTDGPTDADDVLVYNGQVVIREKNPPPGFTDPAASNLPVQGMDLSGSGAHYIARGELVTGQHYAVTDSGRVAAGFDPISAGSDEFFIDAGFGTGFNNVGIDNDGKHIVGGSTNKAIRGALVAADSSGSTHVLSRAGDALDLDGNGLLDDNAVIDEYDEDSVVILDDGGVIVEVLIVDPTFDEFSSERFIGSAIIRIDLFFAVCECELTFDDILDVFDLLAYLGLWFDGDPDADLTGDGTVDVFDLLDYLNCWFAGCPD